MSILRLTVLPLLALSASASAAGPEDRPFKFLMETTRPRDDVVMCLTRSLTWFATPTVVQAQDRSTVLFSNLGRTWAELTVAGGTLTIVSGRGTIGGRVGRSIRSCR